MLFVPSLINRAYILDLMPGQSLLRWLVEQGLRPLLLDWGTPGPEERRFTLTDYICGRLERGARCAAGAEAGTEARSSLGYCMGGMLALALAERRQADLGGLVLMATPWDFHAGGQGPSSRRLAQTLVAFAPAMELLGELPLDAIQALFAALDPLLVLRKFQAFARMEEGSDARHRLRRAGGLAERRHAAWPPRSRARRWAAGTARTPPPAASGASPAASSIPRA